MSAVAVLEPDDDGKEDEVIPKNSLPNLEAGLSDRARELIASLDGTAAAPFLFSDETIDSAGAKAGAHFTARYLKERQPRLYRACVALCGAGYSLREVSELLTISKNTVAAVIDDAPELLGTLKQRTAGLLRRAGLKMAEIMDERAADIPIGQLAVSLGIVNQNAQLLEGEATSIIEQRHSAKHADWNETLANLEAEYGLTSEQTDKRRSLSGGETTLELLATDTECAANAAPHSEEVPAAPASAGTSTPPTGGEGVEIGPEPEPRH